MITLVSAIYSYGPSSVYGGRARGLNVYLPSLINIANFDLPIVIYVAKNDAEKTHEMLGKYFKKIHIVPWEFSQFKYHDKFLELRKNGKISLPEDRNQLLCILKPYWVKEAIYANPFLTDKFIWIDSGLTHHGIFPEKVGGVELDVQHPSSVYYPNNRKNIFNPSIVDKLEDWTRNRLFFVGLGYRGNSYGLAKAINEKYKTSLDNIKHHLIGGIFGGNVEKFLDFCTHYENIMPWLILEKNMSLLEEEIFSSIHSLFPEKFDIKHFDTWWFYSPGERCSYLDGEANSFYKIFL